MKKSLFLALAIVILLVCFCLPIVANVEPASVTFEASDPAPGRGATVTVTVALAGSEKAKSMLIEPIYDASALELQSGVWLRDDGMLADDWSAEFGDAAIAYTSATDLNGDIFLLTFRVLDDAPFGNTTVDCKVTIKNGQTVIANQTTPINIKVSCTAHSYVEKIADEYFKSPADCTNAEQYYKSCSLCGEKGSETFANGTALGHAWGSTYSQNAQGHYRTCTRTGCGANETPTACDGGTASCTAQATCSTCLQPYSTTLPHDYANGTWKSDASGHWKKCKDCTAEDTAHKVSHNAPDDGNCATAVCCTDCNYMTVTAQTHVLAVGEPENATDHIMECTNPGCDYTEDQSHTFDKKVETADYLKNNADCTTAKTYYCSCECGYKGNTTFTVGTELGHDFENGVWVNTDANDHWKKCSRCSVEDTAHKTAHDYQNYTSNGDNTHTGTCVCGKKDIANCAGNEGTATCQVKAACAVCGEAYGTFGAHDYDLTAWGYKGADGHAHVCKTMGCTAHDAPVAHVSSGAATEDVAETCTACGFVIDPATGHIHHTPANEWSFNATHHWKECTGCTEQEFEKDTHDYDNACDTTCNTCGYARTITHSYTVQHSGTEHWQVCSVCGVEKANSRAVHSGGAATCQTKATCTYCGVKYGSLSGHDYDLTAWGYQGTDGHAHVCKTVGCTAHDPVAQHISGGAATESMPETCTACGFVIHPALGHITHTPKTEWSHDDTYHWHGCVGCAEQLEKGEHLFDNACDTACNTCDYTREVEHTYVLKNSETEHWYECACGAEKLDSRTAHIGGTATCTEKAICSVCNTVYGELASHNYAAEWQTSETEHWHACICGEASNKEEHAYGDDRICDTCGYEILSSGEDDKPVTPGEDDTPTNPGGDTPGEGDIPPAPGDDTPVEEGGCVSIIRTDISLIFLILLAFAAWMLRRKQKNNA